MNQNVYNQEYLDKELELKRKGMIYVTAGMGISALTAVINNCLVSALYRNIYIYIYRNWGRSSIGNYRCITGIIYGRCVECGWL